MVLLGHRHAALVLFRTGRANRAGFPPSSQQIRDETHHQTGQPSACSESRPNQLFLLLLPRSNPLHGAPSCMFRNCPAGTETQR